MSTRGLLLKVSGCTDGEYASSPSIACRTCPAGKLANTDGKSCSACPRRTYQELEGQLSCLDCPDNTDTAGTGTTSQRGCVCTPGYYNLDRTNGTSCSACVPNAVCPGGPELPYPVQGFYRLGFDSGEATDVLSMCDPPTACEGGPNNTCAPGYAGESCGQCAFGQFRLAHYCTPCVASALASYALPFQLLGFTLAVVALCLMFDTFSKYATLSILVRFAQLLIVIVHYEISWAGSFSK